MKANKGLYDVFAVNNDTLKMRVIATEKTERNAEAIESMAVSRLGLEDEFFVTVPNDRYKEGDEWEGERQ